MSTDALIKLWGTPIGAVSWVEDRGVGVFQYAKEFVRSNIQVSPIHMPLRETPYEFSALSKNSFNGLPGLVSDSLPDHYGNALIDAWLAAQGRSPQRFNPVERLCYIGKRGMGALEFEPTLSGREKKSANIEMEQLVELANSVLQRRSELEGALSGKDDQKNMEEILKVGTSAGGARAKAVIAWNRATNEFRSGQVEQENNFEHWLIKLDGVNGNGDHGIADPLGFGNVEYAYSLMAKKAGIEMTECRLHKEGGRSHFMTKRFDRTDNGDKMHMQSLAALAHFDYQQPQSYSYEQCIQVMRKLGLSAVELSQQFRRTVFNVIARNQDDHVKNIAFLMDRKGKWKLSPAYDITYAWNPEGLWTKNHQMSINGKWNDIELADLIALGRYSDLKPPKIKEIIEEVKEAVSNWMSFAEAGDVNEKFAKKIKRAHRLYI